MVSIKYKGINNKQYLYAEYSFRLPDGNVKKISKMISSKDELGTKQLKDYFLKKEIEANQKYAVNAYKTDFIFTKEKIEKLAKDKIEFKYLFQNLTQNQMKDLLDRFTANFTYESNAIEGNSLTLKDVTLLLAENIVPKGKELREIYETRNARSANELLFQRKVKISIKDILNIHEIVVKDTGVSSGFKKLPNYLLMRTVKTTPPERVEKEMVDLVDFYNASKQEIHPIKLAARFHSVFEKIHPFEDGNGRVGRLLINAILLDNDYPPLIIRKTVRESYFSALSASDGGHSEKLERFLLEKFEDTFDMFFKVYIKYL